MKYFWRLFVRARCIQEGFDPNDVPYASFKSMSDHLSSSMIPGAEIQTKQLTEGFHEHHSIFFFKFQMVFLTYLSIIDQQRTGNRIFIFAGLIRLKQPYEWSRIPSIAANCTLSSSRSTQKSDLANGFSVVPIQALGSRLPKRLTLTALLWCYFFMLTSLFPGNIVRIIQYTVSACLRRYLEYFGIFMHIFTYFGLFWNIYLEKIYTVNKT